MKRFLTLLMALGLCVALAGSVAAFEGASLGEQNSFGLYDEDDPLDLTLKPGYLYMMDRWRLYTNLSNYEGSIDYPVEEDGLALIEDVIDLLGLDLDFAPDELDGSFYMIGTSGKLGPGSVAFFYETNKLEDEDSAAGYYYYGQEYTDPTIIPPERQFTGQDDYWYTDLDGENFDLEDEAHNFLASYSMDFGLFSLGLAYEPQFQTREQTLSDWFAIAGFTLAEFEYDYSMVSSPWSTEAFYNDYGNIVPGLNYSESEEWMWYGNTGHTTYYKETETVSFTGDEEIEDSNHKFNLGSHIRPKDQYDIYASLMYKTVDREIDGQGTYKYSYREEQQGEDTGDPTEFGTLGAGGDGYLYTQDITSTWSGAFTDRERDGNIWGLSVRPSFQVNDVVQLDLLLAYESGDGDLGGRWTQVVDYIETDRADGDPATLTETWIGHEAYNNTMDGDWDSRFYSIEPRVYLKYDKVRFSLGIGYARSDEDEDWITRQDATASFSYDDGDDTTVTGDWSATGTRTRYYAESYDTEVTVWRFPVATEFDITEKLTIRAGACFTRQTTETDSSYAETYQDDEAVTGTYGDGTELFTPGPNSYEEDAAGNRTPYDPYTYEWRDAEDEEVTVDRTDYRLGLGYQATEHLAFDLMFAGSNRDNGGVDTRTVWASATLAF